jgi:Family of unknown function (DUF6503)
MEKISLIGFFLISTCMLNAQLSSIDILEQSIAMHDPQKQVQSLNATFDMSIVREKHADRFFTIQLDLPEKAFRYTVKNDSLHYEQGFKGDQFEAFFNGSSVIPDSIVKKYDLTRSRTQYLKEVYEYLFLLPMRLQYDTAFLSSNYTTEDFNQKKCYKLTLQYEPIHENETWHFFIDTATFILQGYQFYVSDKATNGEYIYLEDYTSVKGILMPKTKRWYWNKDNSFFRTDKMIEVR